MRIVSKLHRCLPAWTAAALLTLALMPAWAQDGEIRSIVRFRIKADRVGDFRSALKDLAELNRKGGSERPYTVWTSLSGPREYVMVRYHKTWSELDSTTEAKLKDQQADISRVMARFNQCVESAERMLDVVQTDLSLRGAQIPNMVSTGKVITNPGKVNEVLDVMRSDLAPAWKKAGIKSYGVARARFGTPNNEVHTFTALSKWADLDSNNPVQQAMGAEGYKSFLARLNPLVASVEFTLYRYWPELSYTPSAT